MSTLLTLLLLHAPGAPVFAVVAQGTPLDCLSLVEEKLSFLSPRGLCLSERSFLAGYHPQDTDSPMRHTPNLSVKEASVLVLELKVPHTSRGLQISNYITGKSDQNTIILA